MVVDQVFAAFEVLKWSITYVPMSAIPFSWFGEREGKGWKTISLSWVVRSISDEILCLRLRVRDFE